MAIAILLNQSLQSDGVKTKVARQGDRLKIALLGKTSPDPNLCQRILAGLKRLQIADINHCQINAYQVNQRQPIWTETLTLEEPNSTPAVVTAPPTKSSPGASKPQQSDQNSTSASRDRPVKLNTFAFWKRGIAFLLSIPLIVHGSLRFLLTLETMFFGVQNLPTFSSLQSIPLFANLLLQFLGYYAASALAFWLGLLAMRYALQSYRSMAKKITLSLAIAPALLVVLCIISNPFLILPTPTASYSNLFVHPVTGATINRSFQIILIVLNILLLVIGSIVLYRNVIRSQRGQNISFWKELKQSFLQLWHTHRNDVLKLSAVGLLLLCLTNPGPVRHVKVAYLDNFGRVGAGNRRTADASEIRKQLAESKDDYYRMLLVCSWLNNRHRGPITFGFVGHTYARKVIVGDRRSRFDLLNPSNYVR